MHLPAKFDVNRIISNETAAKNVKTRWRQRPSWIFGQYFQICAFPLGHDVPYLCFKFHQNPSIFVLVMAFYVNPRWRRRPSWISVQYFRFWIFAFGHDALYLCFKFHQIPSIFAWVIAIYVNSRWPPPPSWISISTSGFLELNVDWWDEHVLKTASRSVDSITSYDFLFVGLVIMGNPYTCPKFRVFGGFDPLKNYFHQRDPKKDHPWVETRRLSHQPSFSVNPFGLCRWARK